MGLKLEGRKPRRAPRRGAVSRARAILPDRRALRKAVAVAKMPTPTARPSSPSIRLNALVFCEAPPLRADNIEQGLRSLRDLTQHLTTRADDSHAPPVMGPEGHHISVAFPNMSNLGKVFRVASN